MKNSILVLPETTTAINATLDQNTFVKVVVKVG